MARRVYFESASPPSVSPAFALGSAHPYDDTSVADRGSIVLAKGSDIIGVTPSFTSPNASPWNGAGGIALSRQYVCTIPLLAQTIIRNGSEGWRGILGSRGSGSTVHQVSKIYVVSLDGTTLLGELYDLASSNGEAETSSMLSRYAANSWPAFQGFAPTASDLVITGGLLVIELASLIANGGFTGVGFFGYEVGADAALADYTDHNQTGGVGWIEFSQNLLFAPPPNPQQVTESSIQLLDQERYQQGWGADGFGCAWGASNDVPNPAASINHEFTAWHRLIAQYHDRPNMQNLIRGMGSSFQDLEDAEQFVLQLRGLDGTLSILDGLGSFLQVVRAGLQDNTYRIRLAGSAQSLASKATPEDIRSAIHQLMCGAQGVRLREDPPGATVLITFELQQPDGEAYAQILKTACAAGTRIILEFEIPTYQGISIGWESDNTGNPFAEWGSDPSPAGFWAEASDGS